MNRCIINKVPFEGKNLMSYWDGEKLVEVDVRGFLFFKEVTQQLYNWIALIGNQVLGITNLLGTSGEKAYAREKTLLQAKLEILNAINEITEVPEQQIKNMFKDPTV